MELAARRGPIPRLVPQSNAPSPIQDLILRPPPCHWPPRPADRVVPWTSPTEWSPISPAHARGGGQTRTTSAHSTSLVSTKAREWLNWRGVALSKLGPSLTGYLGYYRETRVRLPGETKQKEEVYKHSAPLTGEANKQQCPAPSLLATVRSQATRYQRQQNRKEHLIRLHRQL